MATVALLVSVIAFYTALGRATLPPDRRVPWTAMTARDVALAVVAGVRELNRLHERRWGDPTRRWTDGFRRR